MPVLRSNKFPSRQRVYAPCMRICGVPILFVLDHGAQCSGLAKIPRVEQISFNCGEETSGIKHLRGNQTYCYTPRDGKIIFDVLIY